MSHFLVLGAGGIGRRTAARLSDLGHDVAIASRRGTDPGLPGVRALALDASDGVALTAAATGSTAIINAINPTQYFQWARDWPPVAAAVLAAAEQSGAALVTVSNLYGYGRVDAPMTEDTPQNPHGVKGRLRAQMWTDALAAHEAGRVRVTELRASDYFGADATPRMSVLNEFVIKPAAHGRPVRLIVGGPDVPHSWTYVPDIGALAATLATDDRSWGRAWHVPTALPKTFREVAERAASLAGQPTPRVHPLPGFVKRLARVSPTVRELDETAHEFERPFVIDSSAATETFGLTATPWDQALAETVSSLG